MFINNMCTFEWDWNKGNLLYKKGKGLFYYSVTPIERASQFDL